MLVYLYGTHAHPGGVSCGACLVRQVVMGGSHWEKRRARANAAFNALNACSDPDELVQPWDSISNVVPQSVVTVISGTTAEGVEPVRVTTISRGTGRHGQDAGWCQRGRAF